MEECTSHESFSVRESSLLLQQAIHSGTGSRRRSEYNFTTALSQPLQRITLGSEGAFRFPYSNLPEMTTRYRHNNRVHTN
jgi:hypothetical protein